MLPIDSTLGSVQYIVTSYKYCLLCYAPRFTSMQMPYMYGGVIFDLDFRELSRISNLIDE